MKVYQTSEIRNLALIGGAKAGKTTLAEAMLFQGGVITRRGSVDDKNTVSDYREIELERKNSVTATVLYSEFQGVKINFIDCPGFDDFIGEVIGSLRVADTALMVVNGQSGVDVGTEIDFRWTKKMEKPLMFVVNQLDHDKSNFDEAIRQLKHNFGANVTIVQYPVNAGVGFDSVIDLMQMKMLKFATNGGKVEVLDIPASEKAKAEELQGILMENAAANEESLMEIFFDKGELSEEEISRGLKAGVISRGLFPVFCVAAKTDQGTARLMEAIKLVAPAPNEVPGLKATNGKTLTCNSADPTSLFIFKTSIEQHLGEMSIFKVAAGEIAESADLINPNTDSKERITQILAIAGKNREKVEKLCAGDIGACIKLKNTNT
jgi:elongation factor G